VLCPFFFFFFSFVFWVGGCCLGSFAGSLLVVSLFSRFYLGGCLLGFCSDFFWSVVVLLCT